MGVDASMAYPSAGPGTEISEGSDSVDPVVSHTSRVLSGQHRVELLLLLEKSRGAGAMEANSKAKSETGCIRWAHAQSRKLLSSCPCHTPGLDAAAADGCAGLRSVVVTL